VLGSGEAFGTDDCASVPDADAAKPVFVALGEAGGLRFAASGGGVTRRGAPNIIRLVAAAAGALAEEVEPATTRRTSADWTTFGELDADGAGRAIDGTSDGTGAAPTIDAAALATDAVSGVTDALVDVASNADELEGISTARAGSCTGLAVSDGPGSLVESADEGPMSHHANTKTIRPSASTPQTNGAR
jgi:hypothetical protein